MSLLWVTEIHFLITMLRSVKKEVITGQKTIYINMAKTKHTLSQISNLL